MVDEDLWWLWCGTECQGAFIGPHLSAEAAEADRRVSQCEHDHAVFRMTLRQMAAKLPSSVRWWLGGLYDPTRTPTTRLVQQPIYPHESYEAWVEMAGAIMELKRSAA